MLKAEKRNYAKTFTLELYACEFCELCVQVCPTDAIIMMKSFDMSTADRREMLLDKDRLHAHRARSTSPRGRPATCCATCRRRRRRRQAEEPAAARLRHDARDRPPSGRLAVGARWRRRWPSCSRRTSFTRCSSWRWRSIATAGVFLCSTRSSSPPCSSCSTRAASSPSWSSRSWSPSGWSGDRITQTSRQHRGRRRASRARCSSCWSRAILRAAAARPCRGRAVAGDLTAAIGHDACSRASCCRSSCWPCCCWSRLLGALYFARPEE